MRIVATVLLITTIAGCATSPTTDPTGRDPQEERPPHEWQLPPPRDHDDDVDPNDWADVDPTVGFAEIKECGKVQNVSSSSGLASAASGDGCATLVLAPGNYSRLHISDRSGGVLTIKCAQPGKCIFDPGSLLEHVDGVIIDGIRTKGGTPGLGISKSQNVLVRNSVFDSQTNSGVHIDGTPEDMSGNIQVYNNVFHNIIGCHQAEAAKCGRTLAVYNMDYGVRVYDAKSVDIKNNTFDGFSNHWISLKSNVDYAMIDSNTFIDCGRICINLGQEPNLPAGGRAVVSNNTFTDIRLMTMAVNRMRDVTITGNSFDPHAPSKPIRQGQVPFGRKVTIANNTGL